MLYRQDVSRSVDFIYLQDGEQDQLKKVLKTIHRVNSACYCCWYRPVVVSINLLVNLISLLPLHSYVNVNAIPANLLATMKPSTSDTITAEHLDLVHA